MDEPSTTASLPLCMLTSSTVSSMSISSTTSVLSDSFITSETSSATSTSDDTTSCPFEVSGSTFPFASISTTFSSAFTSSLSTVSVINGGSVVSDIFPDSSSNSSIGVSSKTVFSFSTTVSKCEKGLFMISLKEGSGVKEILVCPSILIRSPVLTFTLSRLLTPINLNVPNPLIFTY